MGQVALSLALAFALEDGADFLNELLQSGKRRLREYQLAMILDHCRRRVCLAVWD